MSEIEYLRPWAEEGINLRMLYDNIRTREEVLAKYTEDELEAHAKEIFMREDSPNTAYVIPMEDVLCRRNMILRYFIHNNPAYLPDYLRIIDCTGDDPIAELHRTCLIP